VTAAFYEAPGRFVLGMSAPIEPGPGEVRLEVAYCGVCGTDLHIAQGHMDHRVRAPQVIGHEMSGVVAEVSEGVDVVSVGDRVVVRPLDTRGETPADRALPTSVASCGFSESTRPARSSSRGRCLRSRCTHCLPRLICV
jgi:(R,R)-butanediol dehydrogenase / meso-butanediol dehydrogenase / diacetyl reductase